MYGSLDSTRYKSADRYWAVVNTPVLAADGSVKYIMNQPSDITQLVQLRDRNFSSLLGVEFTPEQFDQQISFFDLLYKERSRIHELFNQAPGFVCILSGKNYIFEMANKAYIDLFAHVDVIGKPLIDAIPKVEEQGIVAMQQHNQSVPRLFINASGITLSNDSFVGFIKELTTEFPTVDTTKICLEITETAAVSLWAGLWHSSARAALNLIQMQPSFANYRVQIVCG